MILYLSLEISSAQLLFAAYVFYDLSYVLMNKIMSLTFFLSILIKELSVRERGKRNLSCNNKKDGSPFFLRIHRSTWRNTFPALHVYEHKKGESKSNRYQLFRFPFYLYFFLSFSLLHLKHDYGNRWTSRCQLLKSDVQVQPCMHGEFFIFLTSYFVLRGWQHTKRY